MALTLDLVVPLKPLTAGKSRLRGALRADGDDRAHAELVLALAWDTLAAARAAEGVARLLVVTSAPEMVHELDGLGVEVVGEPATPGLNEALRHGAWLLRRDAPGGVVGALQADLPALRPEELAAAVTAAAGRRAFCADRQGTGTTLLLSAPGAELDPRFGGGSAAAHRASGALALDVPAPTLRSDVDTADDLAHTLALGLGARTAALHRTHRLAS